jgi:hypothetical protein
LQKHKIIANSEFISLKIGKKLFIPLMALGLFTIVYWIIGEHYGSGDLRGYLLVQFLPMLIMPIILLSFKRKSAKAYWYLLLFYVFAKLFEYFDGQIFELFGFINARQ